MRRSLEHQPPARRRHSERGFTLMEALVAITILGLIGGLTFGTFGRVMDARERATAITGRYHQMRQAMGRMTREIGMAFLSQARDCSDIRSQTIFRGQRSNYGMRLDFTSFSHFKMQVDAKESDQNELSYFISPDPEVASQKNLMRREPAPIDDRPAEGGHAQILAEDVEDLSFRFYDSKTDRWEDDWDQTSLGTRARLPKYVEISLTAAGPSGKKQKFVAKTRIFVLDALMIPGTQTIPCSE